MNNSSILLERFVPLKQKTKFNPLSFGESFVSSFVRTLKDAGFFVRFNMITQEQVKDLADRLDALRGYL